MSSLARKRVLLLNFFLLLIVGFRAWPAATVNLSLTQCAAGTNWIEYQYNVSNTSTAGEVLYIQTLSPIRINHGAAIVPAGTSTFTFAYQAGTADAIFAPLYATLGTTYNVAYTASSRLMQVTHSSGILEIGRAHV